MGLTRLSPADRIALVAVALLLGLAVASPSQTRIIPGPFINGGGVPRGIAHTQQSVTVNGATTFAITSNYVLLACTGAESINTITGGSAGVVLWIEHTDTECTINDDDAATAADAVDLTGATTNDVGAVNKVITLLHNGTYWMQTAESDN